MADEIVDCEGCNHGHACCVAFRVPLDEDEIENFEVDEALAQKGVYSLKKSKDGFCLYFDRRTRKCSIWGSHPRRCREYTCDGDERIIPLSMPGGLSEDSRFDGNVRIVLAVAVLNGTKKCKVAPMMIEMDGRVQAVNVVEILNAPEIAARFATEHLMKTVSDRVLDIQASYPEVPEDDEEEE